MEIQLPVVALTPEQVGAQRAEELRVFQAFRAGTSTAAEAAAARILVGMAPIVVVDPEALAAFMPFRRARSHPSRSPLLL